MRMHIGRMLGTILVAASTVVLVDVDGVLAQDRERPRAGQREGQREGRQDGARDGRRGVRPDGRFGGGPGGMGRFFRGVGPIGAMLEPELIRRDLVLVTEKLDLDEGQRAIAESLLLDYEAAFAEASSQAREEAEALRPRRADDDAMREARSQLREEFRAIRREIVEMRESLPEGEELDPAAIDGIREKMEPLRERMQALRPEPPSEEERLAMSADLERLARTWRTERERLRQSFMTNLLAILNDEQAGRWPAFQRALRRDKSLADGRLSAESVDILLVLRQLDLEASRLEEIAPLVEAYEVALDGVLRARNEFLDEQRPAMFPAMMAGDFERVERIQRNEYVQRVAVRDLNEQYRMLLREALLAAYDEDVAAAFDRAYRDRAYERIYRPTWAQRSFRAALDLPDLDEETLGAITAIEMQYEETLALRNAALERLTREHEPVQAADRMRRRAAWMRGERPARDEDPIRAAYRERGELDQRYRSTLEGLLAPEQIEQLPEERRRRDWNGDRRGRGGQRGDRPGGDERRRGRGRDAA